MVVTDGQGIPIGIQVASASIHEVKLVPSTLETVSIGRAHQPGRPRQNPARLIGDKAYDSNILRRALAKKGIEPIFPARKNNKVATHQDGRKHRRYKRRWTVERTISWLQNCRRLVVRYERDWHRWRSMVELACIMLILNRIIICT